jgi:hypothetical protein
VTTDAEDDVARATRVVRVLAARSGHDVAPVVLADRSNLVLRLDPLPLVARVAMATSASRVGMDWLRREVEVSRWLGPALATQPAAHDAGPHELEGLVVSLWALEDVRGTAGGAEAGAALAACHTRLSTYDVTRLPRLGGWEEARRVHDRLGSSTIVRAADRLRVARAWERAERTMEDAPRRSASMQAVHGDAHLGNALDTARGVLWTDWEDAFVGPVEWDLACLASRARLFGEEREAIAAAGEAYARHAPFTPDATLVDDLGLARNLQVIVWLALFAERQPELGVRVSARIAAL